MMFIEVSLSRVFLIGLIVILMLSLFGCGVIDFREKNLTIESKVAGLNLQVPSINAGSSLMSLQFGWISTRYLSSPKGGKGSIDTDYNNVSLLSADGNIKSKITSENTNK